MKKISAICSTDFYKLVHHDMYVEGMEKLTSYWTPRMSRLLNAKGEKVESVVVAGTAYAVEVLHATFNEWFETPWEEAISEILPIMENLGDTCSVEHIKALHDLQYLPLEIKSVAEGTITPIGVPIMEIRNTLSGYGWLVNYIETFVSGLVWPIITSATIAHEYKKCVVKWYGETCDTPETKWDRACGDFSMRGLMGVDAARSCGLGHLYSFKSTANVPALLTMQELYGVDISEVGGGIASTEHSVMCSYGKEKELDAYRHVLSKFSTVPVSIVSDTYDYWGMLTEGLKTPDIFDSIVKREKPVYIRGDSGDPVDIICGTHIRATTPEEKGTIECLMDLFGYTLNSKGYKVLPPYIRGIYGDSITLDRAEAIYSRLAKKGIAAENVILGIGSYTYQYVTRDTLGQALKATHVVVEGEEYPIFKEPKTDSGFKKSHRGLCVVVPTTDGISYRVIDQLTEEQKVSYAFVDKLTVRYSEGSILEGSLSDIRGRLARSIGVK